MSSSVHLSSVCNVRAHYSGDYNFLLRHLVRRPSVDIMVKFYGDRPRKTFPSGELNTRGVAEYSDFGHRTLCLENGARQEL